MKTSTSESPRSQSTSGGNPRAPSELRETSQRLARVWATIRPRRRAAIALATLAMAGGAAFNAAIPSALGRLVDGLVGGTVRSIDAALPALGGVALFYLLREALTVARKLLVEDAVTRVEQEITVTLIAHLLHVELGAVAAERVGTLHGRLQRSVQGFSRLLKLGLLDLLPATASALFALAVALLREPRLGVLMAALLPVSACIVSWQVNSQKDIRLELLRVRGAMDGSVVELLTELEYIRTANTEHRERARIEGVTDALRRREIRHHVAMALFDAGKYLNEGLFHIAVLGASIWLALRHQISTGDILTYSVLFAAVLGPLRDMHRILDEVHESSLRVGDLFAMLSEPVDRSFSRGGGTVDPDAEEAFSSEMLSVDMGARRILHEVSVSVRRGEYVGVVGGSGSGKTTWLRAMLGLVHPGEGAARLSGSALDRLDRATIAAQVGYVGQTPFLFAGTIAENIAYGCEGASREAVAAAARRARIHDEIGDLEGGYDAVILERGRNLSGGQRQRLALARVFLRNPPILVLDEATSALDVANERAILDDLALNRGSQTVVLVTHRLESLARTDRVLVFEAGRLMQVDSLPHLAAQQGAFAALTGRSQVDDVNATTPARA